MSTAMFCDKCGIVLPVEKITRAKLIIRGFGESETWEALDVCDECREKIETAFKLKENKKEEN